MSASPPHAPAADPAVSAEVVESWLAELGLAPGERSLRDGVASWDMVLDGRRRRDVRITLILDPSLGLVAWVHYAPPLKDSLRRTYRQLLRWNDTFPFVRFALGTDERPILETEIPARWLDRDELGLAVARMLALCDLLLDESRSVLPDVQAADTESPAGPGPDLLARYEGQLAELALE